VLPDEATREAVSRRGFNGGTPAGWFMDHGKSQSKMDDDWG